MIIENSRGIIISKFIQLPGIAQENVDLGMSSLVRAGREGERSKEKEGRGKDGERVMVVLILASWRGGREKDGGKKKERGRKGGERNVIVLVLTRR